MFERKSIFDIIREAEEDDETDTSSGDDTATADDSSEESTSNDNSDESSDSDDSDQNDDFDIDTDLDDSGSSDEDNSDNTDSDSDISSSDSSSDTEVGSSGDEEPVKANTDIFSSLTAEEQATKIKELKKMYEDLYVGCDDFQRKLGEVDSEQYPDVYERLSVVIYKLKNYISDYLLNKFPSASYIENDVSFNRFLSILKTLSNTLEMVLKDKESQRND